MSDSLTDMLNDALLEALSFMGEIVIIGSESVLAIVNQVELEEELLDGGISKNRGITVVIANPDSLPIIGSTLLYNGLRYRIITVRQDTVGVDLLCQTDTK